MSRYSQTIADRAAEVRAQIAAADRPRAAAQARFDSIGLPRLTTIGGR